MQAQELAKSRGITQLASDDQRLFVKVLSGDGHKSSAVYAARSGDLVQITLRKFAWRPIFRFALLLHGRRDCLRYGFHSQRLLRTEIRIHSVLREFVGILSIVFELFLQAGELPF